MSPFAYALSSYHKGNRTAQFVIRRDDGFEVEVPASVFFDDRKFPLIEEHAMGECSGRVLDVGGAAGRHSLELLRRGMDATTLDILPEMECILLDRGQNKVIIGDILSNDSGCLSEHRFDTLLMLMNGIGMVGTEENIPTLLRQAEVLLSDQGQIICDSIDVSVTTDPRHVAYRENNLESGRSIGQQRFTMECEGANPIEFSWLHIDFKILASVCDAHGWKAERIQDESDGHYLCRITRNRKSEQSVSPKSDRAGG